MNNTHTNWNVGFFVDHPRYKNWTEEEKNRADKQERLLVRPEPTDNAICQCQTPELAQWVAKRLNLAANLEQMAYNFAVGKTDGSDIVDFVKTQIDA